MERVNVEASRSYEVLIGCGLLREAGARIAACLYHEEPVNAPARAASASDETPLETRSMPLASDTGLQESHSMPLASDADPQENRSMPSASDAGLQENRSTRLAALVSDDIVYAYYGETLTASLTAADFSVIPFVFPHGESSKSPAVLFQLLNLLAEQGLTRSDCIVALGGGVVGDLAGFAASIYQRGIRYVQLPTTLLAAVDSSVGGKTAVNISQGKNLVGSFYQPSLVLCDLEALRTLPPRIFSDGMAEVIKYGMIADEALFCRLEVFAERYAETLLQDGAAAETTIASPSAATSIALSQPSVCAALFSDSAFLSELTSIVACCVRQKSTLVAADERDTGMRQLLNFGHTIGHAIERLSAFAVSHGSAVAAGMTYMTALAQEKGLCQTACLSRLERLLARFFLPVTCTYSADALYHAALSDKKRASASITLVLPHAIGHCVLQPTPLPTFATELTQTEAALSARLLSPCSLSGTVKAVASKSQLHRLLICAALSDVPTRLLSDTTSADITATARCLSALGAQVARLADGYLVTPRKPAASSIAQPAVDSPTDQAASASSISQHAVDLPADQAASASSISQHAVDSPADQAASASSIAQADCGESGSTLRFLLPVAAALGAETDFIGQGRLCQRPILQLTALLTAHGCTLSAKDTLPLRLRGRLTAGDFVLPGNITSQYASGLLFALPLLDGDSRIFLTGSVESRSYLDMTIDALRHFGIVLTVLTEEAAQQEADLRLPQGGLPTEPISLCFLVQGGQCYHSPKQLRVEGDWSNAAFFLVAGAISREAAINGIAAANDRNQGGAEALPRTTGLTCTNLRADSLQGDRAIVDILRRFGVRLTQTTHSVTVYPSQLHGCEIDAADIPDLVPVLAVAASVAEGETVITNAARLRLKESDRLESTGALLTALGARLRVTADGFVIQGVSRLHGGTVSACGDHRIAMCAAAAAAALSPDTATTAVSPNTATTALSPNTATTALSRNEASASAPLLLHGAQTVAKSYPDFFADYLRLGGAAHVPTASADDKQPQKGMKRLCHPHLEST